MPIYEYVCHACQQHTEYMQKINEDPKKECPHCHQLELHRVISPVGFQLKGSGWYATDFKDKPKDKSTSTPSTTTPATDAGKKETKEKQ